MKINLLICSVCILFFAFQASAAPVKLVCQFSEETINSDGSTESDGREHTFIVIFDSATNTVNGTKSGGKGYISGYNAQNDTISVNELYISSTCVVKDSQVTERINRTNGNYELELRKKDSGRLFYHHRGKCTPMKQAF